MIVLPYNSCFEPIAIPVWTGNRTFDSLAVDNVIKDTDTGTILGATLDF